MNETQSDRSTTSALVLYSKFEPSLQVYFVSSNKPIDWPKYGSLITDEVDTSLWLNPSNQFRDLDFETASLITFRPGVTDNSGHAFKELLELSPDFSEINAEFKRPNVTVHSGTLHLHTENQVQSDIATSNPLIQINKTVKKTDLVDKGLLEFAPIADLEKVTVTDAPLFQTYPLDISDDELCALSTSNTWALSLEEMKAIRTYFELSDTKSRRSKRALPVNPTDIEMEVFAQTWSEHCKHKIFNAKIQYRSSTENFTVNSIYKTYIKAVTETLSKPWAISVFKDNAGIVEWTKGTLIAAKVETHNSPSALDPYGGALTGILGVNRDILGTGMGFTPIANTDVLCFGNLDESEPLPKALLHPKEIYKGVHKGIQDGGNKSGIPTVNGAILFDENYSGKPLVYCGTIGVAPKYSAKIDNSSKYGKSGDHIFMCGGRVGLDGIHGATASSLAFVEDTPKSMVQIGDPFTQKRLSDFILAARDGNLFSSITDCGAGGISSSIGEMASDIGGAKVDLEKVPLKYPGLKPWQIFVSESQERMTLAVKPDQIDAFTKLAKTFNVEATDIGSFTSSGCLELYYAEHCVGSLDLHFLHQGCPQLKLEAEYFPASLMKPTWKKHLSKLSNRLPNSHEEILRILLSDPNISSKEKFVRQFDHEVKSSTVLKPFDGTFTPRPTERSTSEMSTNHKTAPNDAAAIWLRDGKTSTNDSNYHGVAIASGLCPQFSHIDTELMAKLAVDETFRNLICAGADINRIALLDNFCWPDSLPAKNNPDAKYKLAQLVRASRGLHDICLLYQSPLISGKDSMKNDYKDDCISISVPPTLLITGIAHIKDVRKTLHASIPNGEMIVYEIGPKGNHSYFGSMLEKHFAYKCNPNPDFDFSKVYAFYSLLSDAIQSECVASIHDISDGGLLVALFESLLLHRLGIQLQNVDPGLSIYYDESPGRFVVSVHLQKQNVFEATIPEPYRRIIGTTDKTFTMKINDEFISLETLRRHYDN